MSAHFKAYRRGDSVVIKGKVPGPMADGPYLERLGSDDATILKLRLKYRRPGMYTSSFAPVPLTHQERDVSPRVTRIEIALANDQRFVIEAGA